MSNNTVVKNIDDKKQLKETLHSMKNIFDDQTWSEIFKVLSAILHLGNVEFVNNEMDDSGKLASSSLIDVDKISELLQIDKDEFWNFLTFKSSDVGA